MAPHFRVKNPCKWKLLSEKACWLCELPKLLVYPEEENSIPHDVHKKEQNFCNERCENKY